MQAVDAGVVAFEVLPEHVAQVGGQRAQAAVVQRRCAFAQVVHQQVAHRPAGQVEPVDELRGRALTGAAQLAQPGRRVRLEDPQLVQGPVERRGVPHRAAVTLDLGVEQLQDVADGDLGDHAALGGEDDRGPVQRVDLGGGRPWLLAHSGDQRESRRVTGAAMQAARVPPRITAATNQPARAAPDRRRSRPAAAAQHVARPRYPRRGRAAMRQERPATGPAASAPLASHRSCQLLPGWSSSQSSNASARGALLLAAGCPARTADRSAGRAPVRGRRSGRPAPVPGANKPDASCPRCAGRAGTAVSAAGPPVTAPRPRTARPAPGPVAGCRSRTCACGCLPGLLGVVGQNPADHVFLAGRQVDLSRRELGVPEYELHVVILSFRVIQGCDLRRPVVDSVADETLTA